MIGKVSIIILGYNAIALLKECLASIAEQTYTDIETIVIDNASTDGADKYAQSLSWITFIGNKENLGWAKANNIAAELAKGDFLFFLNNDTKLLPDTIERLVNCYEKKTILAPYQIIGEGEAKHEAAGNGMDIFGCPFGEKDPEETRIFYADGASIFVGRKDFFDIGVFDEKLFMFNEELDFCWRAQLFGYKVKKCDARLYHFSGASTAGGAVKKGQPYRSSYFRRYHSEKNVIRNLIKNHSLWLLSLTLPVLLVFHFTECLILLLTGRWKVVGCYVRAYIWDLGNIGDTLRFRQWVQKRRSVSDLVLLKKMYISYSKIVAFVQLRGFPVFG